jgi:enediyne biosynthesis protein E4
VGGDLFSTAVIAADFDNDGFVDLLVTGYGHVTLYRNKGDGTFEDVTAKAGLNVPGWSISSAWLDYDRDGCVDLFIGRYVKFDPKYRAYYAADNYPGPLDYAGTTNMLFHNNCNGTFTDVSQKSGISKYIGRTMGVTAGDFDGDGYPDIYVANDKTENFLFHNNRNGTFTEVAVKPAWRMDRTANPLPPWVRCSPISRTPATSGCGSPIPTSTGCCGTAATDFTDITEAAGISQLTAQYVSWGTGVYDFDNDGLRDIFIAHGGLIQMVPQEHSIFRNLGGGRFADVAGTAGPFFK